MSAEQRSAVFFISY